LIAIRHVTIFAAVFRADAPSIIACRVASLGQPLR